MKKILLFFIGLLGLMIVSCSNDDGGPNNCSDIDGFAYENGVYYIRSEGEMYVVDKEAYLYYYDKVMNKNEDPCFDVRPYEINKSQKNKLT